MSNNSPIMSLELNQAKSSTSKRKNRSGTLLTYITAIFPLGFGFPSFLLYCCSDHSPKGFNGQQFERSVKYSNVRQDNLIDLDFLHIREGLSGQIPREVLKVEFPVLTRGPDGNREYGEKIRTVHITSADKDMKKLAGVTLAANIFDKIEQEIFSSSNHSLKDCNFNNLIDDISSKIEKISMQGPNFPCYAGMKGKLDTGDYSFIKDSIFLNEDAEKIVQSARAAKAMILLPIASLLNVSDQSTLGDNQGTTITVIGDHGSFRATVIEELISAVIAYNKTNDDRVKKLISSVIPQELIESLQSLDYQLSANGLTVYNSKNELTSEIKISAAAKQAVVKAIEDLEFDLEDIKTIKDPQKLIEAFYTKGVELIKEGNNLLPAEYEYYEARGFQSDQVLSPIGIESDGNNVEQKRGDVLLLFAQLFKGFTDPLFSRETIDISEDKSMKAFKEYVVKYFNENYKSIELFNSINSSETNSSLANIAKEIDHKYIVNLYRTAQLFNFCNYTEKNISAYKEACDAYVKASASNTEDLVVVNLYDTALDMNKQMYDALLFADQEAVRQKRPSVMEIFAAEYGYKQAHITKLHNWIASINVSSWNEESYSQIWGALYSIGNIILSSTIKSAAIDFIEKAKAEIGKIKLNDGVYDKDSITTKINEVGDDLFKKIINELTRIADSSSLDNNRTANALQSLKTSIINQISASLIGKVKQDLDAINYSQILNTTTIGSDINESFTNLLSLCSYEQREALVDLFAKQFPQAMKNADLTANIRTNMYSLLTSYCEGMFAIGHCDIALSKQANKLYSTLIHEDWTINNDVVAALANGNVNAEGDQYIKDNNIFTAASENCVAAAFMALSCQQSKIPPQMMLEEVYTDTAKMLAQNAKQLLISNVSDIDPMFYIEADGIIDTEFEAYYKLTADTSSDNIKNLLNKALDSYFGKDADKKEVIVSSIKYLVSRYINTNHLAKLVAAMSCLDDEIKKINGITQLVADTSAENSSKQDYQTELNALLNELNKTFPNITFKHFYFAEMAYNMFLSVGAGIENLTARKAIQEIIQTIALDSMSGTTLDKISNECKLYNSLTEKDFDALVKKDRDNFADSYFNEDKLEENKVEVTDQFILKALLNKQLQNVFDIDLINSLSSVTSSQVWTKLSDGQTNIFADATLLGIGQESFNKGKMIQIWRCDRLCDARFNAARNIVEKVKTKLDNKDNKNLDANIKTEMTEMLELMSNAVDNLAPQN